MRNNILFGFIVTFLFCFPKAYSQTTPEIYVQSNNSATNVIPLGYTPAQNGNKCQFLILASRMTGTKRAGMISRIYFQPGSGYSVASVTFTGFKIALGMNNTTSFAAGNFITGLTTALDRPSMTLTGLVAGQWFAVDLDDPVYWDGSSNIVFEMSQETYTQGIGLYMDHSVSYNSRLWAASSSTTASTGPAEISFGFDYRLEDPNNAGVDSLMSPDVSGDFCSEEPKEIKVRVKNFGSNSISQLKLDWSLNGVRQPTQNLTFNPPLDSVYSPNNTKVVTLGTSVFHFQTPVDIKAWTSMPNGVADTINDNDTLHKIVIAKRQGVFADITPAEPKICEGSTVILDAGAQSPGTIFVWSNGSITQRTLATKPGKYEVMVQSPTGCFTIDEVHVLWTERPIAGDVGVIDKGNNLFEFTPTQMQNIDYYHWDFGDSATTFASTSAIQQHRYKKPGAYVVSLTVANACDTFSINKQVFVHPEDPTGITDAKYSDVKIYPNPAKDEFHLISENNKIKSIAIYNSLGQRIYERNIAKSSSSELIVIDVKNYPAGIYNVIVDTDNGLIRKTISILP